MRKTRLRGRKEIEAISGDEHFGYPREKETLPILEGQKKEKNSPRRAKTMARHKGIKF